MHSVCYRDERRRKTGNAGAVNANELRLSSNNDTSKGGQSGSFHLPRSKLQSAADTADTARRPATTSSVRTDQILSFRALLSQ